MAFNLLKSEGDVWSAGGASIHTHASPDFFARIEYEFNDAGTAYRFRFTLFMRRSSGYSGQQLFAYSLQYSTAAENTVQFKNGGSASDPSIAWYTSNYGNTSNLDPIEVYTAWIACTPGTSFAPYLEIKSTGAQGCGFSWVLPNNYVITAPNPVGLPEITGINITSITSRTVDANFGLITWNGAVGNVAVLLYNSGQVHINTIWMNAVSFGDLERFTQYYLRSYANNIAGESFSGLYGFRTRKSTPYSAAQVTNVGMNSATISRVITDYGCNNDNTLTLDQLQIIGGDYTTWTNIPAGTLSNLKYNTTYTVRHHVGVTDDIGQRTTISADVSFTTQDFWIWGTELSWNLTDEEVGYESSGPSLKALRYRISSDEGATWGSWVNLTPADVTPWEAGTGTPFPNSGRFDVNGLSHNTSLLIQIEGTSSLSDPSGTDWIATYTFISSTPDIAAISQYEDDFMAETPKAFIINKPFTNRQISIEIIVRK